MNITITIVKTEMATLPGLNIGDFMLVYPQAVVKVRGG